MWAEEGEPQNMCEWFITPFNFLGDLALISIKVCTNWEETLLLNSVCQCLR